MLTRGARGIVRPSGKVAQLAQQEAEETQQEAEETQQESREKQREPSKKPRKRAAKKASPPTEEEIKAWDENVSQRESVFQFHDSPAPKNPSRGRQPDIPKSSSSLGALQEKQATTQSLSNVQASATARAPSAVRALSDAQASSTSRAPSAGQASSAARAPPTVQAPFNVRAPSAVRSSSIVQAPPTTRTPPTRQAPSTIHPPSTTQAPSTARAPSAVRSPSGVQAPSVARAPSATRASSTARVPSTVQVSSAVHSSSVAQASPVARATPAIQAPSAVSTSSAVRAPSTDIRSGGLMSKSAQTHSQSRSQPQKHTMRQSTPQLYRNSQGAQHRRSANGDDNLENLDDQLSATISRSSRGLSTANEDPHYRRMKSDAVHILGSSTSRLRPRSSPARHGSLGPVSSFSQKLRQPSLAKQHVPQASAQGPLKATTPTPSRHRSASGPDVGRLNPNTQSSDGHYKGKNPYPRVVGRRIVDEDDELEGRCEMEKGRIHLCGVEGRNDTAEEGPSDVYIEDQFAPPDAQNVGDFGQPVNEDDELPHSSEEIQDSFAQGFHERSLSPSELAGESEAPSYPQQGHQESASSANPGYGGHSHSIQIDQCLGHQGIDATDRTLKYTATQTLRAALHEPGQIAERPSQSEEPNLLGCPRTASHELEDLQTGPSVSRIGSAVPQSGSAARRGGATVRHTASRSASLAPRSAQQPPNRRSQAQGSAPGRSRMRNSAAPVSAPGRSRIRNSAAPVSVARRSHAPTSTPSRMGEPRSRSQSSRSDSQPQPHAIRPQQSQRNIRLDQGARPLPAEPALRVPAREDDSEEEEQNPDSEDDEAEAGKKLPPGRASDHPRPIRRGLRIVWEFTRSKAAATNPYVEYELGSDWIIAGWRSLQNSSTEFRDVPLTDEYIQIIRRHYAQLRGTVKTESRALLYKAYNFVDDDLNEKENVALYNALIEKDAYTCEFPLEKKFRWDNPILPLIIRAVWFKNSRSDGFTNPGFFKPIPPQVIALVYTGVRCAIEEWRDGVWGKVQFLEDIYEPIYLKHLDNLRELQDRDPEAFRQFGLSLYDQARRTSRGKLAPQTEDLEDGDHESAVEGLRGREARLEARRREEVEELEYMEGVEPGADADGMYEY